MTWFKVDDGFWGHPKQTALPAGPIALWVRAGSWSGAQLTDGFVPAHMVTMLGGRKRDADQLVTAGLWDEVEGGYQFHDWDEFQPTREQVLKDRADARKRMSNRRKSGSGSADVRANTERTSAEVRLPRPDPSRPDHSQSVEGGSHASSESPSQPPLYPDHCVDHQEPRPPDCGQCADARKSHKAAAAALPDYRLRVVPPLCGECDERWIETPDGLAKCPRCYPQERSA